MGVKARIFNLQLVALIAVFLTGPSFAVAGVIAEGSSLKLIVYGATGKVGSRVVNEALNRGHRVTAVSRDPTRIKNKQENLLAVEGNVLDSNSVAALVRGQDVVVVAVRGSVDKSNDPEKTVHRIAAEVIIGVLREMGDSAPRLIFVGGAGTLEVKPGVLYADSLPSWMPKSVHQEINGHILTLEFLRRTDDVRWTYITPAKKFKPGKRTEKYRIGGDQMLLDKNGKSKISIEDFSVALIDEAEKPQFVGKRFSVAY